MINIFFKISGIFEGLNMFYQRLKIIFLSQTFCRLTKYTRKIIWKLVKLNEVFYNFFVRSDKKKGTKFRIDRNFRVDH